jgi:DNA sulfur modification protein DndD
MRLLSIEVTNFRQFCGTHAMNLDTKGLQNVIVIHGENGSGKTTLLNGFKWCFYGETDFDSKSNTLLNERAVVEAAPASKLTMSVKVEFEHENMRHTATREAIFKKVVDLQYEPVGGDVFSLNWTDANGVYQTSHNAVTHMSQILPEKMHPYFFFNGERIEKLAHVNSAEQIQSAIKNLMGLEIVERAIHHVGGAVISKLRKDLKESSPDDLKEAIEKETVMAEQIQERKRQIEQTQKNVKDFEEELHFVNKSYENNVEAAVLNKERVNLEDDIVGIKTKLTNLRKARQDKISTHGGLAFSEILLQTASGILDEKRKKGELPFKVKEQFISDLLAQQRCICERELLEGTPPYAAVKAFKSSTTSADVENAFIETSSSIGQMIRTRGELFDQLAAYQTEEQEFVNEIAKKQGEIDVIGKKIGDRETADIAALETKRGQLQEDIKKFSEQVGALESTLKEWEEQHGILKKERERLSQQHAKNGVATQRLKLAEEVKRVLDALYLALAEQVRGKLSAKVDATFKAIMRKPYWAEISKDYTLQIYKEIGGHKQIVYEKSTAENQITSLSFVGSIVGLAKERSQSDNTNFRGGVFPIVMDSPYGALDPDYRLKIAEYIPELAEQVIIMVSDSQWKGEVESQVKPRMAREFTLHYFNPAANEKEVLPGVEKSEKFEYTEIKEGYYVR